MLYFRQLALLAEMKRFLALWGLATRVSSLVNGRYRATQGFCNDGQGGSNKCFHFSTFDASDLKSGPEEEFETLGDQCRKYREWIETGMQIALFRIRRYALPE